MPCAVFNFHGHKEGEEPEANSQTSQSLQLVSEREISNVKERISRTRMFSCNFEGLGVCRREGISKINCRSLAEYLTAPLQCPLSFAEGIKWNPVLDSAFSLIPGFMVIDHSNFSHMNRILGINSFQTLRAINVLQTKHSCFACSV